VRLRDGLGNLALAAAATLVALLCTELGFRLAERLAPAPPPLDPEIAALPRLETYLELTRPDTRGRQGDVLWRTNGAGMRGPEAAREPAPGTFRIALYGDSFAAGMGVPEEQTYALRLERALAESAGTPVEVLNCGQPGLNARTVALHARDLGRFFRANLYVYGYTLNDLFENEEQVFDVPPPDPHATRIAGVDSRLLRWLRPRWIGLRERFDPNPYARLVLRSYADPQMLARLSGPLAELAALGARDRACVHVFVHTEPVALRFGHPFEDVYERVAQVAREAGLSASVSFPAFRGRDSTPLRLSVDDGHPNAEGHRIMAESLYQALRALPARCGVPPLRASGA
jgi:hypothetical protein